MPSRRCVWYESGSAPWTARRPRRYERHGAEQLGLLQGDGQHGVDHLYRSEQRRGLDRRHPARKKPASDRGSDQVLAPPRLHTPPARLRLCLLHRLLPLLALTDRRARDRLLLPGLARGGLRTRTLRAPAAIARLHVVAVLLRPSPQPPSHRRNGCPGSSNSPLAGERACSRSPADCRRAIASQSRHGQHRTSQRPLVHGRRKSTGEEGGAGAAGSGVTCPAATAARRPPGPGTGHPGRKRICGCDMCNSSLRSLLGKHSKRNGDRKGPARRHRAANHQPTKNTFQGIPPKRRSRPGWCVRRSATGRRPPRVASGRRHRRRALGGPGGQRGAGWEMSADSAPAPRVCCRCWRRCWR